MAEFDDGPVPLIDPQRCDGCGLCVRACPTRTLAVRDGKAVVALPLACEYIGMCDMVCPTQAITRPFEILFPEAEKDSSNSTKVVEKDETALYNAGGTTDRVERKESIMSKDSPVRYHPLQIGFHWLVVGLLLVMFLLGKYMSGLPNDAGKILPLGVHILLGVVTVIVIVIRFIARFRLPQPASVTTGHTFLDWVSKIVHFALYALVLLMAISCRLLSHWLKRRLKNGMQFWLLTCARFS